MLTNLLLSFLHCHVLSAVPSVGKVVFGPTKFSATVIPHTGKGFCQVSVMYIDRDACDIMNKQFLYHDMKIFCITQL